MNTALTTKPKRRLALFVAAIMALTLWTGFPPQASAATGVPYIDTDGELRTTPEGVEVIEITDQGDFSELGEEKETTWYVVYGDFTLGRISLEGNVNLILADGCNLETKTIYMHRRMEFPDDYVYTPTNFTIYGQSAGTGTLTATGNSGNSGIGGWNLPEPLGIATITIAGGRVTAIGGDGSQFGSAGIGGSEVGCGNIVTITGGIVTAIGGNGGSLGGSGIGNGGGAAKTGGSLTVTGGIVTAIGKNNGSGIGGNVRSPYGDNIPTPITITGGIVTATGGDKGSGIGSSTSEFLEITVSGGTLIATGAEYSTTFGIGSEASIKTLDITNAIVFANTTNATTTSAGRKNAILVTDDGTTFYDVDGTVTLSGEFTVPEGKTLEIPAGKTLIIEADTVFYNAGTITGGGTLINNGTIYNTGTISSGFSGTGAITVTIPIITTTSLKAGEYNSAYSQTLSADGNGEIKWGIAEGTLPKGLTLNPTTGIISGIPTQAGTYDFTVKATNIAGNDTQELSLTINQIAQSDLSITNLNLTYIYGQTPFEINTSGGDGEGTVTYSSTNTDVATVSGNQITIHKAGTFEITATKAADAPYLEQQVESGTITVNPKPVTITGVTAENKEYDGNKTATISGTHVIDGNIDGENLTITTGTATFDNKNVANGKTVTFSGFQLDGTAAENYELSQPTSVPANITQKPLTINNVAVNNKPYDGLSTATFTGTPSLVGVETVDASTVTLTKGTPTFSSINVADDININFTDFLIDGDDAGNYSLAQPTGIKANITKQKILSVELTITAPAKGEAPHYLATETSNDYNAGTIVWRGDPTSDNKFAGNTQYTAEIPLTIIDTTNYEWDETVTVTVNDQIATFQDGKVTYQFPTLDPKQVTNLTMTTPPSKQLNSYKHGDTLNLQYLNLKITYDDETTGFILGPWQDVTFKIGGETIDVNQTLSILTDDSKELSATYDNKIVQIGTLQISKATQAQTVIPTLASKTGTTVTLNHIAGAEYSKDGSTYVDSPEFTNLDPNTAYTFYARLAETATHLAGAAGTLTITTLYPVTVTFDTQEGSTPPSQQNKLSTQTVDTVDNPSKADYTFDGWYSEENGGGTEYTLGMTELSTGKGVQFTDVTQKAGEITLYAKWTPKEVAITYYRNDGTEAIYDGGEAESGTYGEPLDAEPSKPTRAGYTFGGWFKDKAAQNAWTFGAEGTALNADNGVTDADEATPALSLYAKWIANPPQTYMVTVTGGTGGGLFAARAEVSIAADAAVSGKIFDSWTGGVSFADESSPATTFIMPANAVTVTATYKNAPVVVPPGSQVEEEGENIKVTLPGDGGTVIVPPGSTVTPGENEGEIVVTLPGEDEPVVVPPGASVMPGENEGEIEVTLPGDGGSVIVSPGSTVDAEGNVTAPDNPPATTGSWVYENGAWKYLVGGIAKTGWLYDTSYKAWFYLGESGIMQTGWVYDQNDKAWYYLASNGKMVAGKWFKDTDGSWYYLSGNGKMLTGRQTISGKTYTFRGNGAWIG